MVININLTTVKPSLSPVHVVELGLRAACAIEHEYIFGYHPPIQPVDTTTNVCYAGTPPLGVEGNYS